ncbi:MAG: hypothetical protein NWR97_13165 [Salibacteraceae bacterium]|jgi:hypothetical protein|nr:hypothetical protein [Salibacteraceae bacterium]
MGIIRTTFILGCLAFATACAPARVIKPLEKGEKQIGANLGGAMINYAGAPIPLPLTSINYLQGLDTGITLSAAVHTTDILFGVMHAEIGLGIKAYQTKSEKFGVTISPSMNLMYDIWEQNFSAYPQLDALCYWQYAEKPNLFYGGLGSWVELNKVKAHNEVQTNELLPYIMVGHQFNRPKWTFTTEAKYLGFQHDNRYLVPDFIGPSHYGALGLYFGISRRLIK